MDNHGPGEELFARKIARDKKEPKNHPKKKAKNVKYIGEELYCLPSDTNSRDNVQMNFETTDDDEWRTNEVDRSILFRVHTTNIFE